VKGEDEYKLSRKHVMDCNCTESKDGKGKMQKAMMKSEL